MKQQSTVFYWCLLSLCLIVSIAGIYQLGHLIGLALYSNSFSINSIGIWQIGLISSGVWGVSEFVRTIKKLKVSPKYN